MTRPVDIQHARRTGNVVSDLAAIVLSIVAIIGLWDGRPWTTFICALVLIVALVSRGWARIALREVIYTPVPSARRLVQGDRFQLSIQVENRKPLPLPWLQLREIIPAGLSLSDAREGETLRTFNGGIEVAETVGLGGYERANLTVELIATRRGHYTFGPAHLRSGDIFGFYRTDRSLRRHETDLVVFPELRELPILRFPAQRPIGDSAIRHPFIEDITRPSSVREFRSGDGARKVDWKTSAKRGELFVRTYDASVSHCVVMIVDCATHADAYWRIDTGILESTITAAATIATRCHKQKFHLGFICNGTPMSGSTPPVMAPASHKGRLLEIMNCLAAAGAITTRAVENLIARHGPKALPDGATILYIGGALQDGTLDFLKQRRARGHPVQVFYTGRKDPPVLPRIDVVDLRPYCRELDPSVDDEADVA